MKRIIFLCITIMLMISACEEDKIALHESGDSIPPQNVSEVNIEPLAGGAKITFSLPKEEDLLMVKVIYEIAPGRNREASCSLYSNELVLSGFGDISEKRFEIFTIDRSGNESERNYFTFMPLTPPVQTIFSTLKIQSDFGGVHINWENAGNEEIAIITLVQDTFGDFNEEDVLYTMVTEGDYAVRGFKAEEKTFGFVIRDRWDNFSDTLFANLTPWFEEELERSKFRQMGLPGGANLSNWGGNFSQMIDGVTTVDGNYGHTSGNPSLPVVFSIDLKVKAKLSRFIHWQRWAWYYRHHNPKKWELWGSNDPNPDGSDDGWFKLGEYESFKPSGLPIGKLSNEDIDYASTGEESVIPLDAPAVRYIRYKMTESWAGGTDFMVGEITAYGQIEEEY
ncbi:DUF5000 domain-containing lipoprotein [Draconibacterium sediminis]|nr:DUF5000 domain-containing lipoprotein [Draconibacterium sediminis]